MKAYSKVTMDPTRIDELFGLSEIRLVATDELKIYKNST